MSSSNSNSLAGIQIMRGIAASMVVLHHCGMELAHSGLLTYPHPQESLVLAGAAGVDIFFVISGFIMVYTAGNKFGSAAAASDFLIRRGIRIVPLYWIITSVLLVGWLSGKALHHLEMSRVDLLCSYTFIPCVSPHGDHASTHPFLDQGWTLSYEWYFYLLFALWLRFGSLRYMVVGIPVLFGIVISIGRINHWTGPTGYFLSDTLCLEFCYGLSIAYFFRSGIRLSGTLALLAALVGICGLLLCSLMSLQLHARWLAWGLPAAFIVAASLSLSPPQGRFDRALARIGDASYSLYLSHGLITLTVGHLIKTAGVQHDPRLPWLIAPMFALSLVLAMLTFRLIEQPITANLQTWYRRRIEARTGLLGGASL